MTQAIRIRLIICVAIFNIRILLICMANRVACQTKEFSRRQRVASGGELPANVHTTLAAIYDLPPIAREPRMHC